MDDGDLNNIFVDKFKQVLAELPDIFGRNNGKDTDQNEDPINELCQEIGKL